MIPCVYLFLTLSFVTNFSLLLYIITAIIIFFLPVVETSPASLPFTVAVKGTAPVHKANPNNKEDYSHIIVVGIIIGAVIVVVTVVII